MKRASRIAVTAVLFTVTRSSYGGPTSPPAPSPASATAGTPSPSPNLDEARLRFSRGVKLYREGDFSSALAEFNRANELGPSYRILYNIGQTQVELRSYAAAMKTFARYLEAGGSEISKDKYDEIASVIATCSERVAEVQIRVNRPGAEVFVDDVSVGRGPWAEAVVVGAGRRKISAVAEGLPPVVRMIEVTGGDHVDLELSFDEPAARAEAPLKATAPVPHGPPPAQPSHTPFWVSFGVTGALGVATLTSGLLALSAKSHLDSDLGQFPIDDARVASDRTRVKTTALATDILGVATFVGAGVTTYFALTTLGSAKSTTVRVGVGPGTVAAEGRF